MTSPAAHAARTELTAEGGELCLTGCRRSPSLRLILISVLGTGVDNIDLAAARAHGVVVTNTPGTNYVSVGELALGLMLATARHLPLSDRRLRQGLWQQPQGPELRGRTLGLIGL